MSVQPGGLAAPRRPVFARPRGVVVTVVLVALVVVGAIALVAARSAARTSAQHHRARTIEPVTRLTPTSAQP